MSGYRSGTDLIMGVVQNGTFKPLGYSSSCKISDSTETGERVTKENGDTHWKEKYVKSLAETISADGFVYDYGANPPSNRTTFPDLKSLWINKTVVRLRYKYRDQGANAGLYEGPFIITSLEQDGPAGDDEKWSVTFENAGAVAAVA